MYGNNFPAMDQNDLLQVVPRQVLLIVFGLLISSVLVILGQFGCLWIAQVIC